MLRLKSDTSTAGADALWTDEISTLHVVTSCPENFRNVLRRLLLLLFRTAPVGPLAQAFAPALLLSQAPFHSSRW